MKIFKNHLKLLISLVIIFLLGVYAFFLYIIPIVADSTEYVSKYENFLSEKIKLHVLIKNLEIKTHPNLFFDISAKCIYVVPKDGKDLFHADNLNYRANILNFGHGKLSADYIYVDVKSLKNHIKFTPRTNKKPLDLKFFPQINVKKTYIKLNDDVYTEIIGINSDKQFGKIVTKLFGKIYSPYTKHPILVGDKGAITYKNKLGFDNFSVKIDNSEIYLSGDNTGLVFRGKNLPANELEQSFLYFYKIKNPNKRNFLENFSDFKGTMDVDLLLDKNGITGKCITHNLGAKFSTLKVDVFLPETVFDFKGREVGAQTKGTFGGEPVNTDFYLKGILTKNIDVKGNVSSVFTNKITQRYYPNVQISGVADANVRYHTQNQKVDVYYTLKLNKGNNLESKWGNLDNTDKNRVISMHTVKNGDPMKIESWDYSIGKGNESVKILSGDGNFEKVNGRYTLSDLSVKTNGKISVNYIKSFLRDYIKNGTFDADLKLGFLSKIILGSVNLYDVSNKDYLYLKNANLTVDKEKIRFSTDGSFFSSPIRISASAANRFSDNILIHNIDIHLHDFFLRQGKLNDVPKSFSKGTSEAKRKKKVQYTVENGRIVIDKLSGNKFDMYNVEIRGSMKDDKAVYVIPKADYANGLLSAKGVSDFKSHSSDVEFYASDIDTNVVMTKFFGLPDHVHGKAFATLHVITKNKLNDVKAFATFAISDGYMPQIANHEFFVDRKRNKKKKHKYVLSKITNIDFSKAKELSTNIYGSFNLDNDDLKNLRMFAKSEWLGLFFEGNYNIKSQAVDLNIWGKRNKTHDKGIKIFKIPLNLLYKFVFKPEHSVSQYEDKIKLIPGIRAEISDKISLFRVSVIGFLGKKKGLKIELKDLR